MVRERNAELAKLAYGSNFEQVASAPVTIALFTDTDLAKRARKIARVGGAKNFSEEQLQYFMKIFQLSMHVTMNNKSATTWLLMQG